MGILKAAKGSVGGVLADSWKEIFVCEGMPQDVLAIRGEKKTGEHSSNTKGDEYVITDGSTIIVHPGQCAIAIDKGQIIGCYDTPGENTYHSKRTSRGLKSALKQSFDRFGYGGVAAEYQVIMYLDLKEHFGNEFRVSRAIRFKDSRTGADIDLKVILSGVFSFSITDPVVFYQNVCANATGTVYTKKVLPQITAELNMVLMGALAKLCEKGITAYELSMIGSRLVDEATQTINAEWSALRGFSLTSIGIEEIALTQGDKNLLQELQIAKALTDPRLAAATLAQAKAQAMKDAARNTNHG